MVLKSSARSARPVRAELTIYQTMWGLLSGIGFGGDTLKSMILSIGNSVLFEFWGDPDGAALVAVLLPDVFGLLFLPFCWGDPGAALVYVNLSVFNFWTDLCLCIGLMMSNPFPILASFATSSVTVFDHLLVLRVSHRGSCFLSLIGLSDNLFCWITHPILFLISLSIWPIMTIMLLVFVACMWRWQPWICSMTSVSTAWVHPWWLSITF